MEARRSWRPYLIVAAILAVLAGLFLLAAKLSGPAPVSASIELLDPVEIGEPYTAGEVQYTVYTARIVESRVEGEHNLVVTMLMTNRGKLPMKPRVMSVPWEEDLAGLALLSNDRSDYEDAAPFETIADPRLAPFSDVVLNPDVPTSVEWIAESKQDLSHMVGRKVRLYLHEVHTIYTTDWPAGDIWSYPEPSGTLLIEVEDGR